MVMPNGLRNPLLFVLLSLCPLASQAQWYAMPPKAEGAAWRVGDPTADQDRERVPEARAVAYDHDDLIAILEAAPREWDEATRTGSSLANSSCILTLPMPTSTALLLSLIHI